MNIEALQEVLNKHVIIIYLDTELNIVNANNKLYDLLNCKEEDILNKTLTDIISMTNEKIDSIQNTYSCIGIIKNKNIYLSIKITPIIKDNIITEIICICVDITKEELIHKSKNKNIILSRAKTMQNKLIDIILLKQQIITLKNDVLKHKEYIKQQSKIIKNIAENSNTKGIKLNHLKLPEMLIDIEISRCRRYRIEFTLLTCVLDFSSHLETIYPTSAIKMMVDLMKKEIFLILRDTDYISSDNNAIYIILTNTKLAQAEQFCYKVSEYLHNKKIKYKDEILSLSYGLWQYHTSIDKKSFLDKVPFIVSDLKKYNSRHYKKTYTIGDFI